MKNPLKKGRITDFPNKIGLFDTEKGTFLNATGDVVLSFPFKDCIIEGGMSDEERGREERFFHETLDRLDIDTLRDPKVLTKFEKIDADGRRSIENPDDIEFWDTDGELRENLLIKGNNLIALYSLRQQLAGKVKLIYIDPPYNTGNDGFRYNDNFRHSTWLVFMKNRLEIARELLREDGAILVHCDDNEQAYLKVLMDEIIGRDNYRNMILTRRFDKNLNNQFVESGLKTMNIGADYVLVYAKSPNFQFNPVYRQTTDERASRGYWKGFYNSPNRPTMRYEILGVDINDGQWKWERNKTLEAVYNYEEYLSNHSNISLEEYWINTGKSKKFIRKNPSGASSGKNKGIEHWIAPSDGILRSSNWTDILTTETNSIVSFSNPKSENVMSELIKTITEENDIVLDYHLGSGTTSAVAHKMGRRWIGIEQMDYIEDIAKVRLQKVVDGEQGGISKGVDWQGGGSFVYMELKTYNIEYIERIESARTKEELHGVYVDMARNAFLRFWFERRAWEKDEHYRALPLAEQKVKLRELLDLNQLYLNAGDMNDARHHVSELDRTLTEKFYGKE